MQNGCGNPCATCGCSPCSCPNPTILNQPRLLSPTVSGGTFTGGTFQGPAINAATLNGPIINGATLDCSSQGCTQPPGTNDATLATTAFVSTAIFDAISAANPAFCAAVQSCLGGSPTLCAETLNCINSTPGALNNPIVFDPAVYATTVQYGVTRFATLGEVNGSSCLVAIDPCTLQAFWDAGGPSTLWTSFENSVLGILAGSPGFCAQVLACGVAPLASPVFTGDPQAPTPAPGDVDTSIATTQFVSVAIVNALAAAITSGNPTFCAAVAGCAGAPTIVACGQVFVDFTLGFFVANGSNYISGATYSALPASNLVVTFTAPQADTNYSVVGLGDPAGMAGTSNSWAGLATGSKTINGFTLNVGGPAADYQFGWAVVRR